MAVTLSRSGDNLVLTFEDGLHRDSGFLQKPHGG